jgi:demethylmenaquinone methyltransferase/2-methoxy-6-polyprenyl-1,4-benzoquinol methylase
MNDYMNTDLISYYHDRAKEYEKIYLKPERQHDLKEVTLILQNAFRGKNIHEISCGTGYWTEKIAKTAHSIVATDINETVLEIAKNKDYGITNVSFGIVDFNNYQSTTKYEGLFGGFIWSHIQIQDLKKFLNKINSFVSPGGCIAFIDNNYVEGSNHPITYTDEQGNTFQTRKLEDGSAHLVRKNFPTENFIREQLDGIAGGISFINLEYYWILIYKSI